MFRHCRRCRCRRPNPTHSPLQHTDSALCANRNGCRRKLIFLFAFLEHSLVAAAAMMVPELLYLHSPSLPVSSSSQRVVNMDTNDIPSPARLIVLYSFYCSYYVPAKAAAAFSYLYSFAQRIKLRCCICIKSRLLLSYLRCG